MSLRSWLQNVRDWLRNPVGLRRPKRRSRLNTSPLQRSLVEAMEPRLLLTGSSAEPGDYFYSLSSPSTVYDSDRSRLHVDDSDIVKLSVNADGSWQHELYFDGSDVGLNHWQEDIDAFSIRADGSLLISTTGCVTVAGVHHAAGGDLLRFTPTSLGSHTAGTWEMFVDGGDVGISHSENIDAVTETADGRLLISTRNNAWLPTAGHVRPEDLTALTLTSTGYRTRGSWERYFDGSDVGLSSGSENVDAVSVGLDGNTIQLSTWGTAWAGGRKAYDEDVLTFQASSLGRRTRGTFESDLALNASRVGIPSWNDIDAFHIAFTDPNPPRNLTIEPIDDQAIDELSGFTHQVVAAGAEDAAEVERLNFDADASGQALAAGTIFSQQFAAQGIRVTTHDPMQHPPMIFDSANPTGYDYDLGTPNREFGGPGIGNGGKSGAWKNDVAQGNILIISEDGNASDPDDNSQGGRLIFDFVTPRPVAQIGLLDIDSGRNSILLFNEAGSLIRRINVPCRGNNSHQLINLDATDVSRLEVELAGSGAVTELVFCDDGSCGTGGSNPLTYDLANGAPTGMTISADGLIEWTPTEAQGPGTYSVTVEVFDGISTATGTFSVAVGEVNQPPVITPIADQTIDELTQLSVAVAASDDDLPTQILTYDLDNSAPDGMTISADGLIEWTPTEAQGPGTYAVTVEVSDGTATTTESFNVAVGEVNQAPNVAPIADQTVDELTPLSVAVAASDDDLPTQIMTYDLDNGAPAGMTISDDGLIEWTPTEAQGPGTYAVTVEVSDGTATTTESFNVAVGEVNQAPNVVPIADQTIDELTTLTVAVAASDADLPTQTLTYSLAGVPPTGMAIDSNGLLTWTPTEAQGPGNYNLTIEVSDGAATTSTSFAVSVAEVNLPPQITAIPDIAFNELSEFTLQVDAFDTDLPTNDLTWQLLGTVPAGLSIDQDGLISWTPTEAQGTDTYPVTVEVSDGTVAVTESFDITVNEVNEAPTLAAIGDQSVAAGESLSFTASATDPDLPANTLTYSISGDVPAAATFNSTTGTFNWNSDVSDGPTTLNVTVTVDDGAGGTDSESFTITVAETSTTTITLTEDDRFETTATQSIVVPADPSYFEFEILDLSFDTDATSRMSDAFEVALLDAAGRSLVHTIESDRDAFYNVSERGVQVTGANTDVAGNFVRVDLSHVPAGTAATIVYRLVNNDNIDGDDTQTTVTVSEGNLVTGDLATPAGATVNSSPSNAAVENLSGLTDVTSSFAFDYTQTSFNDQTDTLFADLQLTNESSQPIDGPFVLVIHNISDPLVGVVNFDGTTADGARYYVLNDAGSNGTLQPGEATLSKTLQFINPDEAPFDYSVTLLAEPNSGPEFVSSPITLVEADRPYRYSAVAEDPDGDELTHELLAGPQNMTVNSMTGELNWQPQADDLGNHSVRIQVSDGRGGFDEQQFTVEVRDVVPNRPPVIVSSPDTQTYLSEAAGYAYQVTAVDADFDPIAFQLTEAPAGMTINAGTGLVSWSPAAADVGTHTVRVTADDGRGGTATQEYPLAVLADPTNSAPVIVTDPVEELFIPGFSNPASGQVTPQRISLDLGNGETFDGTVSITLPDQAGRFADIVISVDESISMGGDQDWIPGMIPLLDQALQDAGIGDTAENPNRFAIVGGGRQNLVSYFFSQQPNTNYTLYGPNNDVVAQGVIDEVLPDELLNLQFEDDGRYVLVVEAANPADLTGGIDIGIEGDVGEAVRVEPLQLNTLVSDEFLLPGQPVQYEFSLSTDTLLYFDSQTKDVYSVVNWSLEGPTGTLANDIGFQFSDTFDSTPTYSAVAGDYTLTIDAQYDTSSDFKFQLLDLAAGTPIISGETIADEFETKVGTKAYRFNATQGQLFSFENSTPAIHPGSKWRLISETGEVLVSKSIGTNQGPTELPYNGQYFLLMEAALWPNEGSAQLRQPSTFEFTAEFVDPAPPTPITLGDTVNGAIDFVGDFVEYSFSLTQRSNLYLDSLVNSSMTWQLSGPAETTTPRGLNATDSFGNEAPVLDLVAGDYTLRVDSNGSNGAFAYRLLDLADAVAITPGTEFSGELTVPTETDLYRFNASAGDRFYVDVVAASDVGNTLYRIVDQYGREITEVRSLRDAPEVTIPTDGEYTLLVEAWRSNTDQDTYTLNVVPLVETTQALTLGSVTSGSLTTPGARSVYTFNLGSDTQLYFDSLTNDPNIAWSLEGPRGEEVSSLRIDRSDSADRVDASIDAIAGNWRLTIHGDEDATGDYSFVLLDMLNAAHTAPITPNPGSANPTVTVTPTPGLAANQTEIFRFDANAGDEFSFVTSVTGSVQSYYRVLHQNGTEVIPRTFLVNDQVNETLPLDGTYLLLVEGRYNDTEVDDWSIDINFVQNNGATTFTGTPLTLGATTAGNLSAAGQVDAYTFTLSGRSVAYFDSLTNSGAVRWNLTGPTGDVVSNRAFTVSDSFNQADVGLDLIAGDYLLEVFASSGTPGAYSFRLHDVADAAVITPGTAFSNTLDPANETHLYKFDANAGDNFYFDVEVASDVSNTQYKLLDPFGRRIFTSSGLRTFGQQQLDLTGSYTLLVEGWRGNTGVDTYTMNVHQVPNAVPTPLVFGDVNTGSLSTPGEVAQFAFSLNDYIQVHFDSLTNSSIYRWTLTGSTGTVVDARTFRSSDSVNGTANVIELVPDDYTLTVTGVGETQDYAFRLLDVAANSTPLSTDTQTTSVHANTQSTNIFGIDFQAGDRVFFESISTSGFSSTGRWRLFDAFGNEVFDQATVTDVGPLTLERSGTYRLIVEGAYFDTGANGEVQFEVVSLGNDLAPTPPTSLTPGQVVNGDIAKRYEADHYAFSLTDDTLGYFDSLTNDSQLNWTLQNENGTLVSSRSFTSSTSSLLRLPAGNYELTITSSTIRPYSFAFRDLAAATIIEPGVPQSGELTIANETDLFRFSASQGEQFFLDVVSVDSASRASISIIDELGVELTSSTSMFDQDTFTIPADGQYFILVEGKINQTVATGYQINLVPTGTTEAALSLGSTQSASIDTLGQSVKYSFSLPARASLYFDSLTDSGSMQWSLEGAAGTVVTNRQFDSSDSFDFQTPLLNSLAAGDYTLTVTGVGDAVGNFSFRLSDVAAGTVVTPGTAVSGELTTPNETDIYQFEGTVGDQILADWIAADDTNNSLYRVFDPYGNEVFEYRDLLDAELPGLPFTGTYTLLIEGWRANTGLDTYQFNLVPSATRTVAMNIGDTITDTLAVNESVEFTFNAASDIFVHFDSLTNESEVTWSLTGPAGEIVSNRQFSRSDSQEFTNSVFELRQGDYRLTVDGTTDFTGDFSFRLIDVSTATTITPGVLTGELNPGIESQLYKFDANAGDDFSFDSLSAGNSSASYRLVDPFGNTLFTQTVTGDRNNVQLESSGTYTLLVEGRYYATSSNAYQIDVVFNGNTPPPALAGASLTLGTSQTGDLNTTGQTDSYQFSLSDRSLLHMDVLTNNGTFRWSLRGPRGVEVSNQAFTSTDSLDSNTSNLDLPAGDYQLDIFASSGTPGVYGFTLHDFADAVSITPGTEFSGEFTNPAETDLYRFAANRGDRFLIDVVANNDISSKEFKLIDRYGVVVATSNALRDVDQIVAPNDGTYTLLVEGRRNNTGTDTYTLNVVPITSGTFALTAGTSTSNPLPIGGEQQYTFSLTNPSLLLFTPQTNTNRLKWTLSSADGTFVNSQEFDDGILPVNLPAGDYTLAVDGIDDYAGDAVFTAVIADSSNQLAFDQIANAELTTSSSVAVYQFNGVAGQHFALRTDFNLVFDDAATSAITADDLSTSYDNEDQHSGIDVALRNDVFRDGAAINFITVSDEDRDILDDNVNFETIFTDLSARGALLNAIVSSSFRDGNNATAIGVDSEGNAYLADGSGGFTISPGGIATTFNISIQQDYIDLAWALDGAAWDLGRLRVGGVTAESFTNAFVDVKVAEILEQTSLRLSASDPHADLTLVDPVTGVYDNIVGGQQYDFDIQIGNDGNPKSFDLLFKQGQTIGSIPVYIAAPYGYNARAVDADGDTLTWSITEGPDGLVVDPATGVLAWPVDSVVYGQHSVTLRVTDGRGGFDEQTFELDVNGGEAASISGFITNQDTSTTGISSRTVFADSNRNGLRDAHESFTTSDATGFYELNHLPAGPYTIVLEDLAGWTNVSPVDGSYEMMLNEGEVLSNTNFVTEQIPLVNSDPLITSTPSRSVVARENYRYQPTVEELDGDDLTFDLPLAPAGMAVNSQNGTLTWTPKLDQVGLQNVLLRVRDERGGFDLQYFSVEVQQPNTAPVITTAPPAGPAGIGLPFTYNAESVDADNDTLTWSLTSGPDGATIDANTGILNWTPAANQPGQQSFEIEVADGRGLSATQSFDVAAQLNPANDDPSFTSLPPTTVWLGNPFVYPVRAADPNGDPLVLSLDESPSGMTMDADGIVTWQPGPGQLGDHTVRVLADDGRGGIASQQFTLSVKTQPVNQPPSITSPPLTFAVAGQPYQFSPTATDPNDDALLWSLEAGPVGMSIDPNSGRVFWNPSSDDIGNHSVTIQVIDPLAAFSQLTYTLRVNAVNTPPVINSTPLTTAAVNATYLYQVNATDADQDSLTFSLLESPAGMAIDPATGRVLWTPNTGQEGSVDVEVAVADSLGSSATQRFSIVVAAGQANRLPVITSTPDRFAGVNDLYTYQLTAADADSDPLTYALLQSPAGMTIDGNTGLVEWTPGSSDLGSTLVEVLVTDPSSGGSLQGFSLTVLAANNAPQITSTPPTTVAARAAFRYDVVATDADGEVLTYELIEAPTGMLIDGVGRMFWIPTDSQIGDADVVVKVTDPRGGSDTQSFTISIEADTAAPQVAILLSGNPVDVGSFVDVRVSAVDNVGIDTLSLTIDGQPVALDANGTARVPANSVGSFTAVAAATDAAGNSTTDQIDILVADPNDVQGPTLSITTPSADGRVESLTDVVGTVNDDSLIEYRLLLAEFGSNHFQQIASGNSNVADDVLGQIDPTLISAGSYVLRLEAEDAGGRFNAVQQLVDIVGNNKLGNFRLGFTDLVVPVSGIDVVLSRTYDSLDSAEPGDFGYGWTMDFRDVQLQVSVPEVDARSASLGLYSPYRDGTRVYITLPGGKREAFTFAPVAKGVLGLVYYTPRFIADDGVTSSLSVSNANLNNSFGEYYAFSGGQPYNPAAFEFGGGFTLTTEKGLVYRINAATGQVTRISDPNGNRLDFSDAGVTSNSGVSVTFERDTAGRITAAIDPNGKRLAYTYDDSGDLTTFTDRNGNVSRYHYDPVRPHFLTDVVDPLGNTGIRGEYDSDGRLISLTDADGNSLSVNTNVNNNTQLVVDELGNQTFYEYDNRGNTTAATNALGDTTVSTFDADNNLLTETDPLGRTTRYTYDSYGNVLTITDPADGVTTFTYANPARGLVASTTDPLGNTTTYAYDAAGNLLSIDDGSAQAGTSQYDSRGNLLSYDDPATGEKRYTYDAAGNVLTSIDESGRTTTFSYDAGGRLVSTSWIQTVDGTAQTLTESFDYDDNGNLIQEVDAAGNTTAYAYDANDRLITKTDALGRVTRFVYNDRGLLTETIYPDNTPADVSDNPRRGFGYDELGRQVSETDELGRVTHTVYDAIGQVIAELFPDSTPTDLADNPRVQNEYDAASQLTAVVDENGNRTEFEYDPAGNRILTRDALGNESAFEFDSQGRQIRTTDALGLETQFAYDDAGRLTQTQFADGTTTQILYDERGLLTAQVDQNGNTIRFQYDAAGRLQEVTEANGAVTSYSYDQAGNLTTLTDAAGRTTTYRYDALNRRISVERPLGESDRTEYDAVGNRVAYTDFKGDRHTFEFDERDRLVAKNIVGDPAVTYSWLANSRPAKIVDGRGATSYVYDERDRLLSQTDPDGSTLNYSYDAVGNTTSVTTIAGTTSYTFDQLNRLETVIDINAATTAFTYDAIGRPVRTDFANGVIETRTYDSVSRLVQLESSLSGTVFDRLSYTFDAKGNRLSVTEPDGRVVRYTYDAVDRLLSETVFEAGSSSADRTTSFTYDSVSNRLTRTDSADGLTTYVYDANDRLLTEVTAGTTTTYGYDLNGNRVSKNDGTTTLLYDYSGENRLLSVDTDGNGIADVSYQYDHAGDRVSRTENGATIFYQVNTNRPLAQTLAEYSTGGSVVAAYTYVGDRLLAQHRPAGTAFHHTDSLGSTRLLTDASGAILNTYTYDAFGSLVAQTGTYENEFLFDGQRRDATTGLDYLRARNYDAGTGRFTSVDPFDGVVNSPVTLHNYLYAAANPVNASDPTGRYTIAEVSFSSSSLADLQKDFQKNAFTGLKRVGRIADKLLVPGTLMQNVGAALMTSNSRRSLRGYDIYAAGTQFRAAGFQAIGIALSGILADTVNDTGTFGISWSSDSTLGKIFGPVEWEVKLLNAKLTVGSGRNKKSVEAGLNIDSLIMKYIKTQEGLLKQQNLGAFVAGKGKGTFESGVAKSINLAQKIQKQIDKIIK